MNAVSLLKPDGTETDISICGKCGAPARGRTNFDVSERCCTCWECGKPLETSTQHYDHYHQDCDRARRDRIDAARLEKAELIEDYDGPVYFEGGHGSFGDSYFADVHELAEWLDDQDERDRPEFVHCCTSSPVAGLDLDSILESACEESFEDAEDHLNGRDELQKAVDAFNGANKGVLSWDVDFKRKCRVPPVDNSVAVCGECFACFPSEATACPQCGAPRLTVKAQA
jgi:ribosomal protein L40E